MTPELLSQWAGTAIVGLLVWSLSRNVVAVDKKLDGLAVKVDSLTVTDGKMQVELTELRVRLTHVEVELQKLQRAQP